MKKNNRKYEPIVIETTHPYFENEKDRRAFRLALFRTMHVPAAAFKRG